MFSRSLFIFRQDLRIIDNRGLSRALAESHQVLCVFIRDDRSIAEFGEDDPRTGLIAEALTEIDMFLDSVGSQLLVLRGDPTEQIRSLIDSYAIDAIFCNKSYSPQGVSRDEQIRSSIGVPFFALADFLIIEPEEIPQRKIYTPYSRLWRSLLETDPSRLSMVDEIPSDPTRYITPRHEDRERYRVSTQFSQLVHPFWTMDFARSRLHRDMTLYDDSRNIPAGDGTTRWSPYLRFGIFSARQLWQESSGNPTLQNELIWREFWYHIAHYTPEIYDLEWQEKRRQIPWDTSQESEYLQSQIMKAKTGYPLIDAGLRQLYETGWMHGRVRMVVASFLTKNCLIDWRWGEKLFAKFLIDYDHTVNVGNWQWSASVGPDPKPVRIFNPLLQSSRFDPDAKYIKKYIPELSDIDPKKIHTLDLRGLYHPPIVDQRESAARARMVFGGRGGSL